MHGLKRPLAVDADACASPCGAPVSPPSTLDAKRRAGPAPPVAFRLLAPCSAIGSLLGHGGDVIASLRASTGARVKLDPPLAGCPDRVLHVSAPGTPSPSCPATAALLAAHDRLALGDDGARCDGGDVEARLLVDGGGVGALLGRRGAAIAALRAATGACVRVLPAKDLPAVAAPGDELVRVSGAPGAVAAALARVAATLRATPPRRPAVRPPPADLVAALGAAGLGPTADGWCDAAAAVPPPEVATGFVPPALHALLTGPPSPVRGRGSTPFGGGASSADSAAPGWASPARGAACWAAASPSPTRGGGGWTGTSSPTAHWTPSPTRAGGAASSPLSPLPADASTAVVSYRLLVPSQAIGAVLGRGGDTARRLRAETGARVRVHPAPAGAAFRVVALSSPAVAAGLSGPTCPAAAALATCIGLILADGGAGRARHAVRLLAPADAAASVLAAAAGVGAATGADVRVDSIDALGGPAALATAAAGDAVVTIDGCAAGAGAAAHMMASLLRGAAVRQALASAHTSACGSPSSGSSGAGAPAPRSPPPPSPLGARDWAFAAPTVVTLSLCPAQADAALAPASLAAVAAASGAAARAVAGGSAVELRGPPASVAAARGMLQAFVLAAGAPPLPVAAA